MARTAFLSVEIFIFSISCFIAVKMVGRLNIITEECEIYIAISGCSDSSFSAYKT
jgi:hypothetical protein